MRLSYEIHDINKKRRRTRGRRRRKRRRLHSVLDTTYPELSVARATLVFSKFDKPYAQVRDGLRIFFI